MDSSRGVCVWSGGWGRAASEFAEHLSAASVTLGPRRPSVLPALSSLLASRIPMALDTVCPVPAIGPEPSRHGELPLSDQTHWLQPQPEAG